MCTVRVLLELMKYSFTLDTKKNYHTIKGTGCYAGHFIGPLYLPNRIKEQLKILKNSVKPIFLKMKAIKRNICGQQFEKIRS